MNWFETIKYDITHYQEKYFVFRDLKHMKDLEIYLKNWGTSKDPFKKQHLGDI